MTKQNQTIIIVVIITIVAFSLGYFLNSGGTTKEPVKISLYSLVGKSLPNIELTDKDGKIISSADFKGKNTVLFFNEGLMCYPACWNQIATFGSDNRFNTDQTQAFSVIVDPSTSWQRAIDQMPELSKSQVLFDSGASVSEKLGLLILPSSMHRGSLPGHTYIVLDKEGIVRYVKDDPNMAIANDLIMSKIAEFTQ